MGKTRFSDEQMVAILRETDRDPIAAVAKRHGVRADLHVAQAVRHVPGRRRAELEAAGGGERAAEEAGGGARPRDRGDEGDGHPVLHAGDPRRVPGQGPRSEEILAAPRSGQSACRRPAGVRRRSPSPSTGGSDRPQSKARRRNGRQPRGSSFPRLPWRERCEGASPERLGHEGWPSSTTSQCES
jgi:hypothetical protein